MAQAAEVRQSPAPARTPYTARPDLPSTAAAEWDVWSTTARIVVTDPAALPDAELIARRVIADVDRACSRFRADSELSRLAPFLADGVTVSELLALLVRRALQAAELSGGAVDPTVGDAMDAWGYDRDLRLVRDSGLPVRVVMTETAGRSGGWRAISLTGRFLRVVPRRSLDLGATAKAVAADLIAERVAARCGCGVLVSLGGDIATAGADPATGPWRIRVQDTDADPASFVTLTKGWGLASSSTQKRTWHRAGREVHHIIDPRTGEPAEPVWRTASVAAPTCFEANVAATAAIVRGSLAIGPLLRAGRPARLVDSERRTTLLCGWPEEGATP